MEPLRELLRRVRGPRGGESAGESGGEEPCPLGGGEACGCPEWRRRSCWFPTPILRTLSPPLPVLLPSWPQPCGVFAESGQPDDGGHRRHGAIVPRSREKTPRAGKTCCSSGAVARSAEDDVTENDPHHQGRNNRQHRPQVFQLAGGGPPVHRFGVVDGSSGRRCLWCGFGGVVLLVSVTRLVGQGSTAGHVCPTGHVCTPGHVAATRHVLTAGHVRVGLWVVAGLARARPGLLVRHVVRLPWIRGCWMCSPPYEMPQWTFQNILHHFARLGEYCRCPNRTTRPSTQRVSS